MFSNPNLPPYHDAPHCSAASSLVRVKSFFFNLYKTFQTNFSFQLLL